MMILEDNRLAIITNAATNYALNQIKGGEENFEKREQSSTI